MWYRLVERVVRSGNLVMVDAGGSVHRFGDGSGEEVRVRLCRPGLIRRLVLRPDPRLGEAWMEGALEIEAGDLYAFLDLLARNYAQVRRRGWLRWFEAAQWPLRRLQQLNFARRAQRNVAHHYDLGNALYRLFLDSDLQYSCAYFEHPHQTIDGAQLAKKRHIAAKLAIRPGMRVLDIGSGWGGLALYLASRFDCEVTGLTLSREQHELATRRADEAGLGDRVRFLLQDYREHRGSYDRIVSVGMFEHVGLNHYRTYFACVRRLLVADGVMLLHSIGRMAGPGVTSPFIRRYIFPGGYIPALSEVLPAVESEGLWVDDIEILRLHYAETLAAWRRNFLARREEAKKMYDERFCRMWEYYLVASELFFRRLDGMVFQMQLSRDRAALPMTRDWMFETERRLRALDAGEPVCWRTAAE
jgi:cyclopropane-fatty-acyl-phospholipid synthase